MAVRNLTNEARLLWRASVLAIHLLVVSQLSAETDYSNRTRIHNRSAIKIVNNRFSRRFQPVDLDTSNFRIFQLDDAIGLTRKQGIRSRGMLAYRRVHKKVVLKYSWGCLAKSQTAHEVCHKAFEFLRQQKWRCSKQSRRKYFCAILLGTSRKYRRDRPN
jgi:hypothetical protein